MRDWLLAAAIVVLLANLAIGIDHSGRQDLSGRATVADGDTLTVNGVRIRLKGIDAPELDQLCRRGEETYACGRASRSHLVQLIGGARVTCSNQGRDRYGRVLGVCEAGGRELNRAMVESGWAVAYGGYTAEEMRARAAPAGLWQGAFDRPLAWRQGDHSVAEDGTGWLARIWDPVVDLFARLVSFVTGGNADEAV